MAPSFQTTVLTPTSDGLVPWMKFTPANRTTTLWGPRRCRGPHIRKLRKPLTTHLSRRCVIHERWDLQNGSHTPQTTCRPNADPREVGVPGVLSSESCLRCLDCCKYLTFYVRLFCMNYLRACTFCFTKWTSCYRQRSTHFSES